MKFFTLDIESYALSDTFTYAWSVAIYNGYKTTIFADKEDLSESFDIYRNIIKSLDYFCDFQNVTVFVHNLKFDIEFFLSYFRTCFKDVTEYQKKTKELLNGEYTYLINDTGVFYTLTLNYKGTTIKFNDSFKLIPMSLEKACIAFGVESKKLTMDYTDCFLTDNNQKYIENDVIGLYQVLKVFFAETKKPNITIASQAYAIFSDFEGSDYLFDSYLTDKEDKILRKSYKGGFCYVNEKIKGRVLHNIKGKIYDINSLYPSVMESDRLFPIGKPGYQGNDCICFYKVSVRAKTKHIPAIFSKAFSNKATYFHEIETNELKDKFLVFTESDVRVLYKFYKIERFEILDTYKFKAISGKKLFGEYIQKYKQIKINSKGGKREVAKLLQNSLYGKFGSAKKLRVYIFDKDKNYHIKALDIESENEISYVPLASYITAYAREVILDAIFTNIKTFLYCDTDSLHINGSPKALKIDSTKYGYFKLEGEFTDAKYLRQKFYIEKVNKGDKKFDVHICGLTKSAQESVNIELTNGQITLKDIQKGWTKKGKNLMKKVKGGYIITTTNFTFK